MTSLTAWEREEREESALPMAVCVHACEIESTLNVKGNAMRGGRGREEGGEGREGEEGGEGGEGRKEGRGGKERREGREGKERREGRGGKERMEGRRKKVYVPEESLL